MIAMNASRAHCMAVVGGVCDSSRMSVCFVRVGSCANYMHARSSGLIVSA